MKTLGKADHALSIKSDHIQSSYGMAKQWHYYDISMPSDVATKN